jgi:hypothetical protein
MGPAVTLDKSTANSSNVLSVPRLKDDGSNWVDYEAKARTALGLKGLIRNIQGTAWTLIPFALEAGILFQNPELPLPMMKLRQRKRKLMILSRRNTSPDTSFNPPSLPKSQLSFSPKLPSRCGRQSKPTQPTRVKCTWSKPDADSTNCIAKRTLTFGHTSMA